MFRDFQKDYHLFSVLTHNTDHVYCLKAGLLWNYHSDCDITCALATLCVLLRPFGSVHLHNQLLGTWCDGSVLRYT